MAPKTQEVKPKVTQTVMNIPIDLTQQEIVKMSKDLTGCLQRKEQEEKDLDSYRAQAKGRIQSVEAEILLLSEKIRTGKEYRGIKCEITWDFKKGDKTYVRTDTGEVLRVEAISNIERQMELENHN